jgi:hypothetical protein
VAKALDDLLLKRTSALRTATIGIYLLTAVLLCCC